MTRTAAIIVGIVSLAALAAPPLRRTSHELPDPAREEAPSTLNVYGVISLFYADGVLPEPYALGHSLYLSGGVSFDWGAGMIELDTSLPLYILDVFQSSEFARDDGDDLELMTALSRRDGTRWVPLISLEGAARLWAASAWRLYLSALADASLLDVSCPDGTPMSDQGVTIKCPRIYSATINAGARAVWSGARRVDLSLFGGASFNELSALNPRAVFHIALRQPASEDITWLIYGQYVAQLQREQADALFDGPGLPDGGARLWSTWRIGLGVEF